MPTSKTRVMKYKIQLIKHVSISLLNQEFNRAASSSTGEIALKYNGCLKDFQSVAVTGGRLLKLNHCRLSLLQLRYGMPDQ